jgi:DNA-binding XRE family transcriptional regulator
MRRRIAVPAGAARSLRPAPDARAVAAGEAGAQELWRQLVEARQAAGLTQTQLAARLGVTQSQVTRIEKRGYEAYTVTTLRRYVQALGPDFSLDVAVRHAPPREQAREPVPPA